MQMLHELRVIPIVLVVVQVLQKRGVLNRVLRTSLLVLSLCMLLHGLLWLLQNGLRLPLWRLLSRLPLLSLRSALLRSLLSGLPLLSVLSELPLLRLLTLLTLGRKSRRIIVIFFSISRELLGRKRIQRVTRPTERLRFGGLKEKEKREEN